MPSANSASTVLRTVRHLDFFFVFAAVPLSGGSGGSLPDDRGEFSFGGPTGGRVGGPVGGRPAPPAPACGGRPGRGVGGGPSGRPCASRGICGGIGRPWASRRMGGGGPGRAPGGGPDRAPGGGPGRAPGGGPSGRPCASRRMPGGGPTGRRPGGGPGGRLDGSRSPGLPPGSWLPPGLALSYGELTYRSPVFAAGKCSCRPGRSAKRLCHSLAVRRFGWRELDRDRRGCFGGGTAPKT